MFAGILFILLLYFASPIILLYLAWTLFKDLFGYYGLWFLPAVCCLTWGILLKINGPGDPNADFSSIVQVLAGSHILGIETPSALIAIGIFCLVARPVYRIATAGSDRDDHA